MSATPAPDISPRSSVKKPASLRATIEERERTGGVVSARLSHLSKTPTESAKARKRTAPSGDIWVPRHNDAAKSLKGPAIWLSIWIPPEKHHNQYRIDRE